MSEQTTETQPDAVTKVARDLREIEDLHGSLEDQAVHQANDHEMPGGDAMVALAGVANLEAWQHRVDTALRIAYQHGDKLPELDDEEDYEPPLQTLLFWSEQLRREHDAEYGQRPTVASEASFIRHMLGWMWDNEPHFADFADDIDEAKRRLEDLVAAGKRDQRGVQCFDCQVDLTRKSRDRREYRHCTGHDGVCTIPHARCPHDRGGLADEWRCPSCDRRYDTEAYHRAVGHAHFAHADYLTLDECAERTSEQPGTIKVWATRGKVRKRKDLVTGRMTYNVPDVMARRAGSVAVADETTAV